MEAHSASQVDSMHSIITGGHIQWFLQAMVERTRSAAQAMDETGVICSADQAVECNLDRELRHRANYRDLHE